MSCPEFMRFHEFIGMILLKAHAKAASATTITQTPWDFELVQVV